MDRYLDYLTRDIYFNGDYMVFNHKITLNFINRYSMIQNLIGDFKTDKFEFVKEDKADIDYTYFYDSSIKNDGYRLEVSNNKGIELFASSDRGFLYGQRVLEDIIKVTDSRTIIPICVLEDEADFELRGIIEGFYGAPWSFEDRKNAVEFLSENRMNTYMYAPKDDLYHRQKWRETYPNDIYEQIKDLKNFSDEKLVDFYYCISPGNDIDVTNNNDIEILLRKIKSLVGIGVKDFALLLDDIDYTLKGNHSKYFRRIGQVHAYVTNKVYEMLEGTLMDFNLIMCPSEYWQNYETLYRDDLDEFMNENVRVFWTGYNTIAPNITKKDCKTVMQNINRELILWDNIPVNDLDKENIFLSPIKNRFTKMKDFNHKGIVSNPMQQFNLSKIPLITFSHFMWNGERYNKELSLEIACKTVAGEKSWESLMEFCNLNNNSRLGNNLLLELREAIENFDTKILDDYFDRLEFSLLNMQFINDKKFLNEVKKWTDRARFDIETYKALKNIELKDINEVYETLKNKDAKIGHDVIQKIIKSMLDKI